MPDRSGCPGVGPVRRYGDALALVTVTRTAAPPRSQAVPTRRPITMLHVDTAGAPATGDVLRIGEDIGWAAAVNRAIAGLDGDVGLVAVADPGVDWGVAALDALLDAAARHPRAGLLGPALRDPSGAVLPSSGSLPSSRAALHGRIPTGPGAGPVGWVAGSCVLLRRSAWDSVDGLDPRYPGGGPAPDLADVDLGDRLGRAGWLVVAVPAARVTLHPVAGQCILEPYDRGLRRYLHDRYPAPVRALAALWRRPGPAKSVEK